MDKVEPVNAHKQITSSGIILLLTATIDPRSTIMVLRSDPKTRMIDYRIALCRWLSEPGIDRIIFCENSGADLDQLRFAAAQDNVHGDEIIFVSYSAPEADGKRGKGYGEMGILACLLSNNIINYSDTILKVTGRYSIANFKNILSDIQSNGDADVITSTLTSWKMMPSECFYAKVSFLDRYLIKKREMIHDTEGYIFESVLAQAVNEAVLDGAKHVEFTDSPHLVGISGGTNLPRCISTGPEGVEVALTADYLAFIRTVLHESHRQVKSDSEITMDDDILNILMKIPVKIFENSPYVLINVVFTYTELCVIHRSIMTCLRNTIDFMERTGFSQPAAQKLAVMLGRVMQVKTEVWSQRYIW